MKFSIVIPTYNRWDLLKKCLTSIKDNTDLSYGEIIVVSNGCADYTPFYFEQNFKDKNIHLIHWPEPLGYPKAVNNHLRLKVLVVQMMNLNLIKTQH